MHEELPEDDATHSHDVVGGPGPLHGSHDDVRAFAREHDVHVGAGRRQVGQHAQDAQFNGLVPRGAVLFQNVHQLN